MPDTDRYREWAALLAASDAVLLQIIGLAVLAVAGWELLRRAPEPWRGHARRLYLALGLGTLLTALTGQVNTWLLAGVAALFGAGAMTARALWARMKGVQRG